MSEYDFPDFEAPNDGAAAKTLPFGLSMQAISMILLILALLGVLWLFFGPSPDSPTGLATATARPADTMTEADSAATAAAVSTAPTSSAGGASAVGTSDSSSAPAATTLAGAATADLSAGDGTASSAGAGTDSGTASATGQAASSVETPAAISANDFVKVVDTEGFGLRLRFGAGLDYVTIRIVDEGEVLRVTGGPETGDGESWYRLQDALGNVGWGAVKFIAPAASPPLWSPPIASPTFPSEADSGAGSDSAGASGAP